MSINTPFNQKTLVFPKIRHILKEENKNYNLTDR